MDLTTTYLGLPLKNPLVASASPLLFELEYSPGSRMRAVRRWSCRCYSKSKSNRRVVGSSNIPLRVLEALPKRSLICRARRVTAQALTSTLEIIRKAREAVSIPVIASCNGINGGGLGPIMRVWRRTPAQARLSLTCFSSRRSIVNYIEGRASVRRSAARGEGRDINSRGDEAQPLFQRACFRNPRVGTGWGRWLRACSTVFINPTSTSVLCSCIRACG